MPYIITSSNKNSYFGNSNIFVYFSLSPLLISYDARCTYFIVLSARRDTLA